ncbi:hypothetical protein H2200_010994 [Cladophialophora chaetospira]|uniref:Uncharacterized protein n=1 Tax=Cladophialophora chaetospira TaxID=386627 RepID=A0AA39CE44_9EURO|nr:hypothetical protein H2200_010994 [Cladophialophora chaetospira]
MTASAPVLQKTSSGTAANPGAPAANLSLTDERLILSAFESRGLTVKDDMKTTFLETVYANARQQSSSDDMTADQLLDYAVSMSAFFGFGIPLDLVEPILDAAEEVASQYEADTIYARYLSAITTAQGLAPESVKILAAVKEVSERSMSSHESVSLEADATAIQEFLGQEISPFMEELARRRPGEVPMQFLRRKRDEVKSKREQQRRNVQFYLQRVEEGLSRMEQQTYSIYTNQMPRYAAACALEVLLMGYHCMLGKLDEEDFILANDQSVLKAMVAEKSSSILTLLDRYGKARAGLVIKQAEKIDWAGDSKCYVSDEGAKDDVLVPKVDLQQLAVGVPTEGTFTEGKLKDDGRYKYSGSSLHDNNYAAQAGDRLIEKVRKDIAIRVQPVGSVLGKHFAKHLENMQLVLNVVQRHESRYSLKIQEAKMLAAGQKNLQVK